MMMVDFRNLSDYSLNVCGICETLEQSLNVFVHSFE